MSTRDRRKANDDLHAGYEDTHRSMIPGAADTLSLARIPQQRQYEADITSNTQSITSQPTASAIDVAGVDTDTAAQGPASSLAAPQRELQREVSPREATSRDKLLGYADLIERRVVELAIRWFEPAARIAIFVIYFWFGFLKLLNLSPATPLAAALTRNTIGMQYFTASFKTLAVYECVLGILFLIPALTRLSCILLVIHMGIVASPLVIVASVAWIHPLVPTLEGQYIIKNLAIIALAIGILACRRGPRLNAQLRLSRLR